MRRNFPLILASVFVMFTIVALLSCNRTIDSTEPVRTFPEAPSTPVNVSGLLNDQSITLQWEVLDTSSVKRFRIYLTDSTGQEARLRDSTPGVSFNRTIANVALNQTMYFRVATVGQEGIEGMRSSPPLRVRLAPLSIVIDNGREYANRREITVRANAPSGVTNIKLSENADLSDAVFKPFTLDQSFTLSDGDGLKRLYAHFVFTDGIQTGSPVIDEIMLDTRARIDTVYFLPAGTTFTTGSAITFRVRSGEPGGQARISFPGVDALTLYDDGASPDAVAGDGEYSLRYVVPMLLSVDDGQVTGAFTDAAGNQAPTQTAFSTLNIVPATGQPTPVVLAGNGDSDGAHLTWSENSDSDFAMYRLYRATDTTRAVDTTSQLVAILNSRSATSYDDAVLLSYPALAYRVYVFNQQGKASPSNKVIVLR